MNNKPIILLLEENELNIGTLYSLYAQKIPAKEAFWNRLSNEEVGHAGRIGSSSHADQAGEIIENKFSRGVIRHVMDFVLESIEKAKTEDISHQTALKTALRIERSMLEKKCFDMFTPSSLILKELLQKLNGDTERHIESLVKELKKTQL